MQYNNHVQMPYNIYVPIQHNSRVQKHYKSRVPMQYKSQVPMPYIVTFQCNTTVTFQCITTGIRSGSVVECLTRDRGTAGFEPHRRHCDVVLEQNTFILAKYWFNPCLTKRLLIGRKESNQTNRSSNQTVTFQCNTTFTFLCNSTVTF